MRLARHIDDAGIGIALDGTGRAIAGYAGDRLRRMGRGGRWGAEFALAPPRPEDVDNDFAPEPEMLRVGMSDAAEAVATWLSDTDDPDVIRVGVLPAPPRH